MKNIKMHLQFDGSRYSGWQRLGDKDNTVQGKLEDLLKKMTAEEINVIGCSRTDKGVHAQGLVCNFFTNSNMTIEEIGKYINRYLPDDIVVYNLSEENERFHSRYNAKSKWYRYTIDNNKYQNVFSRKFTSHIPEKLNLILMQEAATKLIGTFDFTAFTTMKSKKKSFVRTIMNINISKENNYIYIDFEGDGFLHNMIRIITGTLIRVGKEEISPSDVQYILENKNRSIAGPMIEAKGLCLMEVRY
ncbi:tRNA pseudouridine38-40 synthase [Tissierella praeacuta DSM 18095]|uniref:tRNA pseudouridine synthase A n=1 Tax=Tissierella praeacuta DSM 18095 TaxID=1123404 RepID=A0A1M4W8X2_9FIRM|nr:tRNA pseudouridine(38-40) synthase TruA [Tissierella praeacuta]SHE77657.1 tRNA pseudouridine38-40 synthase [Tissierella praeacuta DSM 18095]SUO99960.1 tRNA pseudouridine synthase A [Tissierella praeacuta]